jgi:hypothetical protein
LYKPLAAALLACGLGASPAQAQSGEDIGRALGGILANVLRQSQVASARRSWEQVDRDVLACFERRNNTTAEQLIQAAVPATDRRLQPYFDACSRELEQQRLAAAAAAERAEQERRAAEALAEQQRQAQLVAEAEAAAAREERRRQLVARYGADQATAILAGEVRVGMSAEAVREAVGAPQRVDRVAVGEEMWIYDNMRVVVLNNRVSFVRR